MKREQKYQLIIALLAVLVFFQAIFFLVSRPKKKIVSPPAVVVKGKIAIVLDDWGYNLRTTSLLEKNKLPLTISVLPNLPYSAAVNEKLHHLGYEIILHLPLEPFEKYRLEKNTILMTMSEKEILSILANDLKSVSYAKGVSNHMGSKATQDAKTMEIILRELKKRKLYFLDSMATSGSVCARLAKDLNLKFSRRNIFLDNKLDADYIRNQLNKLKKEAVKYGQAVGIGHDRKVTLEVLSEVMPKWQKEGYKFVFVSEVVK